MRKKWKKKHWRKSRKKLNFISPSRHTKKQEAETWGNSQLAAWKQAAGGMFLISIYAQEMWSSLLRRCACLLPLVLLSLIAAGNTAGKCEILWAKPCTHLDGLQKGHHWYVLFTFACLECLIGVPKIPGCCCLFLYFCSLGDNNVGVWVVGAKPLII